MAGTRLENGQLWNSSSGNTLGTERLQEKAGTTEEQLGRCHQTGPPTDGLDLGRSRGAGEWRRRVAQCSHPDAG